MSLSRLQLKECLAMNDHASWSCRNSHPTFEARSPLFIPSAAFLSTRKLRLIGQVLLERAAPASILGLI